MPPISSTKGKSFSELEVAITQLSVAGFKSIRDEQSVEIRPLTIFAGANSAGKSSIMQPLLLLKQTLEAPFDPGSLLLNGPNVRFTHAKQLLSRTDQGKTVPAFLVKASFFGDEIIELSFQKKEKGAGLEIKEMNQIFTRWQLKLTESMSSNEIKRQIKNNYSYFVESASYKVIRDRCFLFAISNNASMTHGGPEKISLRPELYLSNWLNKLIHVPALRGNPERNSPITAVGPNYTGTFNYYVASILAKWQSEGNKSTLNRVGSDLKLLGLTWTVKAKSISDAEVEIYVGRVPRPSKDDPRDLVSIADVGFGVSQSLPVVVALHACKKGDTVYIEQPEIHLHPRAQVAMAKVLANAIKRGVRVIIETHSQLLLLAIRTLVAKDELPASAVKLHWFTRDPKTGFTTIRSADLDDAGAFGDWPEDFGDVEMEIENCYLDAADAKLSGKRHG